MKQKSFIYLTKLSGRNSGSARCLSLRYIKFLFSQSKVKVTSSWSVKKKIYQVLKWKVKCKKSMKNLMIQHV